jgi:hypothetical protein
VPSSRPENQITWAAAASITLTSATAQVSDAFTFHVEDFDGAIQVSADNAGTPATGDVVNVYLAYTTGDLLGDSGSDYDTTKGAMPLGRLNTYASDADGEDPQRKLFVLPTLAPLGGKLIVQAPNAASRNITVRARRVEHRGP